MTPNLNVTDYLKDDFAALDACIQTQLHSDVELVQKVSSYIVKAGGKRLRPALLLLAADAVGLAKDARATSLAAVVEFIHTATLLHDDVVDESGLRRGKPTANALFGNAASVLVGDFLYSRAFQMMVRCENLRVMDVLADATNVIAEGEVLQLMHMGDASLTEAQYLKVIEYKTAKLFEAAARLPAVLLGDAALENALADFGRKIGAAFQIIDDVLDYEGDSAVMGKNLGDDLREGKVTLPLIFAMQRGTPVQRAAIEAAIDNASSSSADEHAAHMHAVLQAVQTTQATLSARQSAQALVTDALACLDIIADSPAKTALQALAQQAVARQH
jgi:octaprenyl-diphosphate synthase